MVGHVYQTLAKHGSGERIWSFPLSLILQFYNIMYKDEEMKRK